MLYYIITYTCISLLFITAKIHYRVVNSQSKRERIQRDRVR